MGERTLVCRECGTTVPTGHSVCPTCRGVDLRPVPRPTHAGRAADPILAYHTFQRRRQLAAIATAATTLLLLVVAIVGGLLLKELVPQTGGSAAESGSVSFVDALRIGALFLLFNPLVLVGLALALGLTSYRLWHRLLTGEAASVGADVLGMMGGRPTTGSTRPGGR
jgi:ribosomal protein L40E